MNTPHITRSEILPLLLTLPLFVILATANGAGYRYGASDQAFYVPVVVRALDPSAFPRDASLIDAQGRFMLADEPLAAIARATGLPLPSLCLAGYLLSLALVWAAIIAIGGRVYRSAWLTIALGAALTLRHRIPRTSANSLEPYFHPRTVAFGLGALAVAALLRGRRLAAVALVAAVVHVMTGLWFTVLVGVALLFLRPPLRRPAVAAGALAAAAGAWAVAAGPLRASMTIMDEVWLQAVSSKDSLFPIDWPAWAWAANLALPAVLWWAFRIRVRRGVRRQPPTRRWSGAPPRSSPFFSSRCRPSRPALRSSCTCRFRESSGSSISSQRSM